ncbi:MAG: ADP-forming succinate--CoA ligase subunit beta [Candidatus Marinarcus sp.]|uniref:ADP-forming succinate--CoA ligase subunit beta n=1 Tax=Candidatus Marinarcus sp. TaxID=3100987 RepID=UPI003B0027CD
MNIHEYQAKQIFHKYYLPTPKGFLATSINETIQCAKKLGGKKWVLKAQVHTGGRGKAGGIKVANSLEEVKKYADELLGMVLVTKQTGPEGKLVSKIYIEEGVNITYEAYLGIVLDRALEMPVMMGSRDGGVEIEKVAQENPQSIKKIPIDPTVGFQDFHGRELAFELGIFKEDMANFIQFAKTLYRIYLEDDAELIEINPLVKTDENKFLALDGKMGVDDSALFRHDEIEAMRDLSEEDKAEVEAAKYGLSYIKLDGNVGCMVNGAGLAMATMDIITYEGGTAANFLDVGGNASAESVAKGFELILRDKNVKSIFVNIFAGIVRCDRIANGIIEATHNVEVNVPIVVRLDGTNAKIAAEILNEANIKNIIVAHSLEDGAKKAVEASKK